jgi:P27 family predicted phage terminase small subunit
VPRGRKPTPTSRQVAEGDPRKRGVNKLDAQLASEPKAERGLPECPEHLGERARWAWDLWKEELEKMQLDARPDQVMLEGACVNYGRAVEADLLELKHGPLIAEPIVRLDGTPTGRTKIKANPAIAISNKSWKLVHTFCSEFGLSPVSRTRLTIEKGGGEKDELLELLSRPRESKKERVQ